MADLPTEKCLDDFFAKRDKKKKKEKGKGKEPATGPTVLVKKNKKDKEKNTKSDNQDAQLEKVTGPTLFGNFFPPMLLRYCCRVKLNPCHNPFLFLKSPVSGCTN